MSSTTKLAATILSRQLPLPPRKTPRVLVMISVATVVEAAAGEVVADVEAIAVAAPMELTIARQHYLQAHYLQAHYLQAIY
jgi:hypothetical protein